MKRMNYRIASAFTGIGAWEKGLSNILQNDDTFTHEYYFEIDKYASNSYAAIHNVSESLNLKDITNQPDQLPKVDIFFYSPPCQTFSIAGQKTGTTVAKGKLFDYAIKCIEKSNPKFAIMENVSNLVNQFRDDYKNMLKDLESIGYVNYAKVLNAKDYGTAQNRERIFIVSIRKDIYDNGFRFRFPEKQILNKKLINYLENQVDNKFILSEKMIKCLSFTKSQFKGRFNVKNELTDIANCLDTKEGGRRTNNFIYVKENTKTGYVKAIQGDSINLDQLTSKTRRGRVGHQIAQTLTTSCNQAVITDKIRKLTPLECFRLQGFDDIDYKNAVVSYDKTFTKGKSDTQMYIRAGNSICVTVVEALLKELLYPSDTGQLSFL